MKLDDLTALVHAGFTKEEIIALNKKEIPNDDPATVTDPGTANAAEQNPEPSTEPEHTETEPKKDAVAPEVAALMDAVSKLTETVNALQQSNREEVITQGKAPETVDDILAQLINPKED